MHVDSRSVRGCPRQSFLCVRGCPRHCVWGCLGLSAACLRHCPYSTASALLAAANLTRMPSAILHVSFRNIWQPARRTNGLHGEEECGELEQQRLEVEEVGVS